GAMTDRQASAISGALDGAGADTCRRVDDHLREHPEFLQGKGYKRLQSDIRDLVQKLEPETSRERAERAARSRHVTMTPLADGMARVSAVLRGIDAVALMHSLRTRAESLRASGAKDSLSALAADLLVDDVLQAAQHDHQRSGPDATAHAETAHVDATAEPSWDVHPRCADVERSCQEQPGARPGPDAGIVIPAPALLGRDDAAETAELEGYGSIP